MKNSYEDFRAIAQNDGDGWGLYKKTRGTDFSITPWEWLLEACPYANEGTKRERIAAWVDAVIAYNAWASSVGRAPAEPSDMREATASEEMLRATFARITEKEQPRPVGDDYLGWTDGRLEEALAVLQAKSTAREWLVSVGEPIHSDEDNSIFTTELLAEIERRRSSDT